MTIARRAFLTGLGSLFVAPAIVRADNLMKVKSFYAPDYMWLAEYEPEANGWIASCVPYDSGRRALECLDSYARLTDKQSKYLDGQMSKNLASWLKGTNLRLDPIGRITVIPDSWMVGARVSPAYFPDRSPVIGPVEFRDVPDHAASIKLSEIAGVR